LKSKTENVKFIVFNAILAALYIGLTYLTYPVSYGDLGIELRVSEVLVLLCFFNKKFILGLTVGCFLGNLFGPMGIIDAIFGTSATLISCYLITKTKNLFIASLFPVIINGIIVGLELMFLYEMPLYIGFLSVAIGEFIVVSIVGCLLFKTLKNNKSFNEIFSENNLD